MTLRPLRGTRVCFGPKFAISPPDPKIRLFCGCASGPTARRAGDARAPALHVTDDLTFRRHRMSIRMDLVYAIAKKTTGQMVSAATLDRPGGMYPQRSFWANHKPGSTPAGQCQNSGDSGPLRRTSGGTPRKARTIPSPGVGSSPDPHKTARFRRSRNFLRY